MDVQILIEGNVITQEEEKSPCAGKPAPLGFAFVLLAADEAGALRRGPGVGAHQINHECERQRVQLSPQAHSQAGRGTTGDTRLSPVLVTLHPQASAGCPPSTQLEAPPLPSHPLRLHSQAVPFRETHLSPLPASPAFCLGHSAITGRRGGRGAQGDSQAYPRPFRSLLGRCNFSLPTLPRNSAF